MSRDPLLLLEDVEQAGRKVTQYVAGRTRDEVFADEMRFDAVLHNLHVIGEAVKNLSGAFRERYADVPWREVAGMRDFVAHAYFALDLDILWDAIVRDVPSLTIRVREIAATERDLSSQS